MRIKITNETRWSTRDLRRFLARAAKYEEMDEHCRRHGFARLVVRIQYRRAGGAFGYAFYNSNSSRITLPREKPPTEERLRELKQQIAHTMVHEFAHNRGRRHRDMAGNPDYCYVDGWRERVAWAEALPLTLAEPKTQAKPDAADKLEHCREKLTAWAGKVKRAQTGMKKWQQRVRYYERQLAVAAKRGKPKQGD